MDTKPLERFARAARRKLHDQVAGRLDAVLGTDSAALRGYAAAISNLKHELCTTPRAAVIERVAYTWFNRFCALRYMDANGYTPLRIVSPAEGFTLPEILQEAKAGVFDDELSRTVDRRMVSDLLAGRMRSGDPQGEAYRLLLVAACNAYHESMPFMFEPIADVTELLMPADLLSPNSVLAAARDTLTSEACQDVEVIGWLYQFYIAEKKDEVDAKVKQGGKVEADELPAKTALYTPHWIVRYLVENSLGRLWLLNRPGSRLAEHMPYYIRPEEPETDFLVVRSPEELTVGDPACGSGHMLTYAFDLLYRIYEEEGYNPPDIPRLILEKNLFGMEIDPRSAALAAFALTMKARGRDRRFLRRGVAPHICAYTPATVTEADLRGVAWFRDLSRSLVDLPIRDALLHDLRLWEQIANIGSLLQPQLMPEQIETLQGRIGAAGNLLDGLANERVLGVLGQLAYLARQYHVVVTNPPYLGDAMNIGLKEMAESYFPDSKADLFSMFIQRNLDVARMNGYIAMITMQNWMFLSSYEAFRAMLLSRSPVLAMAHLGSRAFDTISGEVVSTTAFVLGNRRQQTNGGLYSRLTDCQSEREKEERFLSILSSARSGAQDDFYRASYDDFQQIPGSPVVYWASDRVRSAFGRLPPLSKLLETREGLTTGSNEKFLRLWHEVGRCRIRFGTTTSLDAVNSGCRWFPYVKGGSFRRWAGNQEYVVDWEDDGRRMKGFTDPSTGRVRSHNYNGEYAFRAGLTWSGIASGGISVRAVPVGFMFDAKGPMAFTYDSEHLDPCQAFLNSKIATRLLAMLAPTLDFKLGHVLNLPFPFNVLTVATRSVKDAVIVSRMDWASYETSWEFSTLRLCDLRRKQRATLERCCRLLFTQWREETTRLQRLEEENNRIFIEAYGLQDEFTPDVPLSEITLTCNPYYRYGGNKSEEELEKLLRADTMRELISYAVGCMLGRYSLDKPGLILANAGETLNDYLAQVPHPTFLPDKDNVIPILDGDWFTDDIVARFQRFLRITFGEEHNAENLAFIETALGRDLRSFFVREFYDDHLKRYQRRPIYWLFSSPGGSFNALVYMHRYRLDTVSVVLNDYLREYIAKLTAARSDALHNSIRTVASNREKAAALKEAGRLDKVLKELAEYEAVLLELARKQVQIDLDDGVKVNYAKFGSALRRVVGLNA